MTKDEVLKLKNSFYSSYYCKDDICASTHNDYSDYTVDLPDRNGNMTTYLVQTCNYNKAILGKCKTKVCFNLDQKEVCNYYTCKNDSQCLSNKCVNGACVYNEENPIIHCDSIYSNIFYEKAYMYCGKAMGEKCNKDKECSAKRCNDKGYCGMQLDGPSDNRIGGGTGFLIIIILIIIITISCCIYCCYKKRNRKNIQNKSFYNDL